MKNVLLIFSVICLSIHAFAQKAWDSNTLFDADWRFHRGGSQRAENPDFNDSDWRLLNLPHDWSIEDIPGTSSPFNRDAISQVNGGFTTGGTGWYRKSFTIPVDQKGKRVIIQFDGVYMNAEVWINGKSCGNQPYGYSSFWYDLTKNVKFGLKNIIAVKVKNEGENSRWYSGSGIYRHVWLKLVDPVHLAQWGTAVVSSDISTNSAKVNISAKVNNNSENNINVKLVSRIIDPNGLILGEVASEQLILSGEVAIYKPEIIVANPKLWDIESPHLYKAINEVLVNGEIIDQSETKFGIRNIQFDVLNGFQLNGKPFKLKGGCFHHDNGPLGAKSFDRAEERKIELLKASGFNAIRCSHNPASPALLDACDRLGMLVIAEAFDMWVDAKNPNDYHLYFEKWWQKDMANMINRDINHPSIILWSIGNEIPKMNTPEVAKTAQMLADFVRKTDPSRKVIAAVNGINEDKDPFFKTLDIAGYNYGSAGDHGENDIFDYDHKRIPSRIMIQTESFPLDAFKSWMHVVDHPWLAGDFVWTAFDYIGEASIGWLGYYQYQSFYPWNLAFCGDIDICGWKRPQSYYRDALWKTNQLSLFVKPPKPSFEENNNRESWSRWHWHDVVADWNWTGFENTPLEVTVYSSCEEVELFLNNQSIGRKKTSRSTEFKAVWNVPYSPGELKAVGYKGKKQVNTAILRSASEPVQIRLSADRDKLKVNGQDLCYVTVELMDKNGTRNPKAENLVTFEIEGPGSIVGVGNANPVSIESYQLPRRKAWQGRCMVVIQAGIQKGVIVLKAKSDGIKESVLSINLE